jgi:hypothetical protein
MIHCHNCKAVIASGHQHKIDGKLYHANCVPREPTIEVNSRQFAMIEKQRQAYIAALELVLLYHVPEPLTEEQIDTWRMVTGQQNINSIVLCEHIRKVLG